MSTLYILAGIMGAGKSTWANENAEKLDAKIVSRDEIRFNYDFDPDNYFKHEKEVIKAFYRNINTFLSHGYNVIADATHTSLHSLKSTVEHCKDNADKIELIYFETDLYTALAQNSQREGKYFVPENVIVRAWKHRYPAYQAKEDGLVDFYSIIK